MSKTIEDLSDEQRALLKEILTTKEHNRRDKIALKLSDEGVVELIPVILTLLFREDTKRHRSTLIYCLQRYNLDDFCSSDFYFLSIYEGIEDNYGCLMEIKHLYQKLLEKKDGLE